MAPFYSRMSTHVDRFIGFYKAPFSQKGAEIRIVHAFSAFYNLQVNQRGESVLYFGIGLFVGGVVEGFFSLSH